MWTRAYWERPPCRCVRTVGPRVGSSMAGVSMTFASPEAPRVRRLGAWKYFGGGSVRMVQLDMTRGRWSAAATLVGSGLQPGIDLTRIRRTRARATTTTVTCCHWHGRSDCYLSLKL